MATRHAWILAFFCLILISAGPSPPINTEIIISDINDRPLMIAPGESVTYRLQDTTLILRVSSSLQEARLPVRESAISPESTTAAYWQTCGIDVWFDGPVDIPGGRLRNRALVVYSSEYTFAPAYFSRRDMRGTRIIILGASWRGLKQTAEPGMRTWFSNQGVMTAEGTLSVGVFGANMRSDYVISELIVRREGTFCR